MIKITIVHSRITMEILFSVQETLFHYIREVLQVEEVEVFLESYKPQHSYASDSDEMILLCDVYTKVDRALIPKHCHIIPIVFDEENDLKKMDSSLQNINCFVYNINKKENAKSTVLLCEAILAKLGLIKNTRKIFISYKRKETSNLAEKIQKILLSEGYSVFLDKSSIDVGADFMQEIRYSIVESDVFLLLNSNSYFDSIYTKKEFHAACISGVAIVVVSHNNVPVDLNGLSRVSLSNPNRITKQEADKLIDEIQYTRIKLWRTRHNRMNNKLQLIKPRENVLQGAYIPNKANPLHSSIYTVVGIPTTMDFQRIKQREDLPVNSDGKVYTFYDDLILPSIYSKHLDWLDKEMPNVDLLKMSTFEKVIKKMKGVNTVPSDKSEKPIVFLSASVPNWDDENYDYLTIHDIVVTLTETIIKSKGTLVFGGHPTITPIITNIMEVMAEVNDDSKGKEYPNIYLYQSRFFDGQYPIEVSVFPEDRLEKTDIVYCNNEMLSEEEREKQTKMLSLQSMREKMISSEPFNIAIFIGGKYDIDTQVPQDSGVWKEYELFTKKHPDAKIIYFENTGMIAALLYEQFGCDSFDKITVMDLPKKLLAH